MTPRDTFSNLRLGLDPLLDPVWIWVAAALLLPLGLLLIWQTGRRGLWRVGAGLFILGLLFNPTLIKEIHRHTPDVVLIVADRSPSQTIADRQTVTDAAFTALRSKLGSRTDLEVRVRETTGSDHPPVTETSLFSTVEAALEDVPVNRRAGVILVSDGRIADAPSTVAAGHEPVHLLLTGHLDEKDTQIRLLKAPAYGLTGKSVSFSFSIETTDTNEKRPVEVTLLLPDGTSRSEILRTNTIQDWELPIPYPGQNVFEMKVPHEKDELTFLNNRAVFAVAGVRDRLKVLLVTGTPHPGERTWRDLFKDDPGIDLVHFTILRTPMMQDPTPQHELSLIAFPVRQLFETKLREFDLVVLDRFQPDGMLAPFYFENLRNYVENGGALLELSGPSFGTVRSLYQTALGAVYPARPNGTVVTGAFKPAITDLGKTHPVTRTIAELQRWGAWLQFMPVTRISGDVLMTATGGQPLLILDRVGKGRIAQMASDQVWLWSRGYDGGGPTRELLRRIVHWLMKEPELEEDSLEVHTNQSRLEVRRRIGGTNQNSTVTVKDPAGVETPLELKPGADGWLTAGLTAKDQGIYEFSSGDHRRIAAYGDMNSRELRELTSSATPLAAVIKATRGSVIRLEETPVPEIRFLPGGRDYGGKDWIGLRQNNETVVIGTEQTPLFPALLALLLGLAALILPWWREGRNQ